MQVKQVVINSFLINFRATSA